MESSRLFGQLTALRDSTAVTMRDAIVDRVPAYRTASTVQHSLLLDNVHEIWARILERAATAEPFTDADLQPFGVIARQKVLHAVVAGEVEAGFHSAYVAALKCCLSAVDANLNKELTDFISWGADQIPRALQAMLVTHAEALRELGKFGAARAMVLKHLLEGTPVEGAAAAAGMTLSKGYLLLLCRPQRPSEYGPTRQPVMLGRALTQIPGALWQGDCRSGKLLILLPTDDVLAVTRSIAAELVATISDIVGQPLYAAEAHAPCLDAIPEAFQEARQTIVLISAMPDAQSHPYRSDELLVELAIARQPALLQRLANLLAPLRQGTDLHRTLVALFQCGLDRERTTRTLHIHRRTLTYRLQRIRELTGLDPTTAHGIQLLRTAITAAQMPATPASGIRQEHDNHRRSPCSLAKDEHRDSGWDLTW